METGSAAVILKAMEGLQERIAVTAENIANANTPHYRPLRVSFEKALSTAAARGPDAVKAVRAKITQESLAAGGLRLDMELASDSTTAERYSALIEVLNRQLQLQSLAITGSN